MSLVLISSAEDFFIVSGVGQKIMTGNSKNRNELVYKDTLRD